jgi:uncharacterized protein
MIEAAQRYFKRMVFKTYRYFKHPRVLKRSKLRAWFAKHFLDKVVWKPTQHTFAGGLAVGMLVMIQLMPGQMPVAAILAALLRVNIPIAVIACWISNPVTFVPFGYVQKEVGQWFMPRLPALVGDSMHGLANGVVWLFHWLPTAVQNWLGDDLVRNGSEVMAKVYLGGIIIGPTLALISYPLTYVLWEYFSAANARRKERQALGA